MGITLGNTRPGNVPLLLLGEDGEGGRKDQRKKFQISHNVRGKKKTELAKAKVIVTSGAGENREDRRQEGGDHNSYRKITEKLTQK